MKKMLILLVGIAFCLGMSSCAAPAGWHKEGVSEYDTENALAQCKYEKGKDHVDDAEFVTNCMKRQGYRWKEGF